MHPEVALAMAHARHQDLRRSGGRRRSSNPRPLSEAAGGRRRPLAGLHLPLVAHRPRLGR